MAAVSHGVPEASAPTDSQTWSSSSSPPRPSNGCIRGSWPQERKRRSWFSPGRPTGAESSERGARFSDGPVPGIVIGLRNGKPVLARAKDVLLLLSDTPPRWAGFPWPMHHGRGPVASELETAPTSDLPRKRREALEYNQHTGARESVLGWAAKKSHGS